MFKNLARVALTVVFVLCLTACGRDAPTGTAGVAEGPEQAILWSAKLAIQGDVAALLEHMLPPADFARVKAEWNDRTADDEISEEERTRFAETMAKLTAPDAADTIYAEIEPDLRQFDAQYKQQVPAMVAMGQGYLQGMVQQNQQLSDAEKEQAGAAIKALGEWVQRTNFTDPALVKQALVELSATARALELETLDEGRALSFEQAAPKLMVAVNGLKKVFDVYGFSVDRTLESVKTEVISNDGQTAKLKVDYTLLGTPLSTETDMVKLDGRWYAKDTIDKLKQHAVESTPPAAAAKTDG